MIYDISKTDWRLVQMIIEWSDANNLPPELQLALCYGESSFRLTAEKDDDVETSEGGYQINRDYWGGEKGYWTGYDGLHRSMELMKSEWQRAFESLGSWDAWLRNKVLFLYRYWPEAQQSIQPTWERSEEAQAVGYIVYVRYLKMLQSQASDSLSKNIIEYFILDVLSDGSYHMLESVLDQIVESLGISTDQVLQYIDKLISENKIIEKSTRALCINR